MQECSSRPSMDSFHAPREAVRFMISFLLHNEPAMIGSRVIPTQFPADLNERRERNVQFFLIDVCGGGSSNIFSRVRR